jgi:hypothetical protein
MLFTEPLVFYLSIYTAFGFAMLFSFFGSYPLVFMEVYHFDIKGTGLAFLGILVGSFSLSSSSLFSIRLYTKER